MIWQRHWAEMRMGMLMFAGLGIWSGVSVTGPWRSMEFGLPLPETPLGLAIGADQVLIWAEFAGRILPFSLMATLTLAGAGFDDFGSEEVLAGLGLIGWASRPADVVGRGPGT